MYNGAEFFYVFIGLGEPLRAQKKPPIGGFFCGSRRAIRGSLRSYLRPHSRAWYASALPPRRYYPSRRKYFHKKNSSITKKIVFL